MHTPDSLSNAFLAQYHSLLAFVKRRAASTEAAADIVHDAFVRVATLRTPERVLQPQAFFVRMVENLLIDRFREQRAKDRFIVAPTADDEDDNDYPSDASRPDLHAQAVQTANRLDAIVAALPARCREVFLLRKVEDLSHEDIAARLNISRNMVEKHLRRALMACQDASIDTAPPAVDPSLSKSPRKLFAQRNTATMSGLTTASSLPRNDNASSDDV